MMQCRIPFRTLMVAALLCSLAIPARAARWDTYNNANVLNSVRAVSGAVWTASDLGLHRFDPATGSFTRYTKATGRLVSNAIVEVEVDDAGNTWFATRDRGVSVLTRLGEWRALSAFEGLPSDNVTCLQPSALGMWVGTEKGLALFDGLTLAALWPDGVNPSPFASNLIHDVAIVGDSTYVATDNGLYVTRSSEGVVWQSRVDGLASPIVTSVAGLGSQVWCVAGGEVYSDGQTGIWSPAGTGLGGATVAHLGGRGAGLFAGATTGVYRWDGVATWQLLGAGYPGNAWVDVDLTGGIWAGNSEGLWRWDGTNWKWHVSAGPGGNWVQGMQLKGSTLYIATRDNGVSRFNGSSWRTFAPQPGASPDTTLLVAPYVFGLLADRDGTLWAGQWSFSLAHLDDRTEPPAVTHYYDVSEGAFDDRNTFVWSSAVDPFGNRWFGLDTNNLSLVTPIGINRIGLDDSRANFSPQGGKAMSGPQVRAITFAPGGAFEMWVAYARLGVDVFTDPTLNTRLDHIDRDSRGLLNDDTWAIEMNGDSVWIATSDGLSRYSRATRTRVESVATQSPSSQGAVHPLSIDAEGGVWWATSGGVVHRRPDRTVEIFTSDNSPLLSNDVHSVYADRVTGDVWIGTVLGVNRYNATASGGGGGGVAQGSTFGVYPNPAFLSAAGTLIRATNVAGPFKGKVYDVHGRVVRDLLGNASTGSLWDGTDTRGERVRPGVYFFQIQAGGVTRKSRVLLLR